MKIGIIVHSQTGNTYSVAEILKEKLTAGGHTVNIEKVIPVSDTQTNSKYSKVELKTRPDIGVYDGLIFGGPVRGAALSPVIESYLSQLVSLRGKKITCFVTEAFPFKWMGGNRAIGQMKKICESKDAKILETGIVNWMNSNRSKMINEIAEKMSKLF